MSISLLDLVLSFRSSFPGRWSVRCIRSKVTFLRGLVCSTTGLTGWIDRSRSSVFLIFRFVRTGIVRRLIVVGVRVRLTTTTVFISTIHVISGLIIFSSELAALVSIVTWLSTIVAMWFGLLGALLCIWLRHSVYLHLIWGLQTIQFQLPFKMRHNLFICVILQMRLVD